ncbi:MAG: hypothetical protein WAK17_09365 [Candidatus Nitrosopolaris sp.]
MRQDGSKTADLVMHVEQLFLPRATSSRPPMLQFYHFLNVSEPGFSQQGGAVTPRCYILFSYYAWTQLYPNEIGAQVIPDFTVGSGECIPGIAWI